MNSIGGYFELELHKGQHIYHDTAFAFKSGRSSLRTIFEIIKPSLVHIPFYTCDGLLEPFITDNVNYKFYMVNQLLEPEHLPELETGEYFLYVNYFMKGNGKSWFFNSCRKFFGVPDGSFLYPPGKVYPNDIEARNEAYNFKHLLSRFNAHTREGYSSFQENEILCGGDIKRMSKLSEFLLSNVNFKLCALTRRSNYLYLHNALKTLNIFEAPLVGTGVPMYYPFLLPQTINREALYAQDIFVPTLWNDVLKRDSKGFETEKLMAKNLLPLPVDHRYNLDDMKRIVVNLKTQYDPTSLYQAS
jgi:hypothetical protein